MRDLALAGVFLPLLAMAAARPFVGVLVWSWISFMNPHREAWGFTMSIPWAMLAFVVTVFGCFVAREPRKPAINAVTVLLCVFSICITITSLAAITPPQGVWWMWDKVIKIIIGLLLTASLLTERRRIDALVWLMVIAVGYYGVKGGLFTLITGGQFIVLGPDDTMISDRNHLAVAMLVTLPLMNYLRLQARHAAVRKGLVFAMVTTLFAVIGSQSRGALVGLVATAGVFWLRSSGKIVSGAAIALAIAAAILFMPDTWVERMSTMRDYEADGSAMGRIMVWIAAIELAKMRPLLGVGFQATYTTAIVDMVTPGVTARATHSIWLEVLADHGIPTFLVWLGILGSGVWYMLRTVRLTRTRPELRWAHDLARMSQASAVAYCSGGSFLSLSYWDYFWTLLVVAAATYAHAAQTVQQQDRQSQISAHTAPRGSGLSAMPGRKAAARAA